MKILLITERFFPEVGAAPSRLTNMAEGLREMGADVDVLTSLPNYPQGKIYNGYRFKISHSERIKGCTVYRYWVYSTISKSSLKRALNMISFALSIWLFAFRISRIRKYNLVIIQTPTLFAAASAMTLFKGVYRRKCVLNVSDIWPSTAVDLGVMKAGSLSYKVMAYLEKKLYKKADAILGQSNEILTHVAEFQPNKKVFLYRNLQKYEIASEPRSKGNPFRVIFAGMLGVAQDVFSIVQNVDFRRIGVEFHIVGGGSQYDAIKEYLITNPDCNIILHGVVPKEEMAKEYKLVDAAIVPLTVNIKGAFPSKIFDILPMGLPILFSGSGEGASYIENNSLGYVSKPSDYNSLTNNLIRLSSLSKDDYRTLSSNCLKIVRDDLDFDKQIASCYRFLFNQE